MINMLILLIVSFEGTQLKATNRKTRIDMRKNNENDKKVKSTNLKNVLKEFTHIS